MNQATRVVIGTILAAAALFVLIAAGLALG